jgi:hypothetical protein
MKKINFIEVFTLRRILPGIIIMFAWSISTTLSYASDDVWSILKREGDVLDLMALEALDDKAILIGAKYIEKQWRSEEVPQASQFDASMIRKILHVMSINVQEQVEWQHSYSAMPDVNEIYATSRTRDGRLCIAYGGNYANDEFINPVILQVNASGKIIWANKAAIPEASLPKPSTRTYVQIANIESIRIVETADNGCLLGYILRHQTEQGETFQLNLLSMNEQGDQQWHFVHETTLYGKMFLIRNGDAHSYTVAQTNQSRDAAIEAMMAARPFSPLNNILVVSDKGELVKYYDSNALSHLSKIWIKHIVDVPGDEILMVGNSKNAWAGFIDINAQLKSSNDTLKGEFLFVRTNRSKGYIMVRDDSVVSFDDKLTPRADKEIEKLVKQKYVNAYLQAKLPERGPIQNIVPLGKNAYFILYKLASRLQKIEFND